MALKTELDKSLALEIIYGFFKEFQGWVSHAKKLSVADLEHYLAKNFHFSSNGKVIANSAAEYLDRCQKFQKKYEQFVPSKPLEEPLIHYNQIAFHYKIDLTTHQKQQKQVYIATIATIEERKILLWNQIAHEKGSGDWDK